MKVVITPPPMPDNQQLLGIYSYLYQMSQTLNTALNTLSTDNFDQVSATAIKTATNGIQEANKANTDKYNTLKSLIIKTADIVEAEMNVLRTELYSNYVAQSEFGEYKESVKNDITASAEGIMQEFTATYEIIAGLEEYQKNLSGYIKTGILEDGVLGVEIMQDNGFKARFAANKLSFYQGAQEVAYISNNQLYITNATVTGYLRIGNFMIDTSDGGFALRYVGGAQ